MKQIYLITYSTGKIYIEKDSVGSHRYFGSPDIDVINADFATLPESVRKDYSVRKRSCGSLQIAQKLSSP